MLVESIISLMMSYTPLLFWDSFLYFNLGWSPCLLVSFVCHSLSSSTKLTKADSHQDRIDISACVIKTHIFICSLYPYFTINKVKYERTNPQLETKIKIFFRFHQNSLKTWLMYTNVSFLAAFWWRTSHATERMCQVSGRVHRDMTEEGNGKVDATPRTGQSSGGAAGGRREYWTKRVTNPKPPRWPSHLASSHCVTTWYAFWPRHENP